MILKSGKWFGWLAGLALAPVAGWGQPRIIQHPQNTTVCAGEVATFITETDGGVTGWKINGTEREDFRFLGLTSHPAEEFTSNNTFLNTLIINYSEMFNGLKVQSIVRNLDNLEPTSTTAYLFYETSQESPVTGLIGAVNNGTAQIYWNAHNSNFTTEYLVGVYDHNSNLIANQTTDSTYISYDLPPRANDTCQYLEFRVTANQCPDPENGFIQTEGTTFIYTRPDVSPVTAEFDNYQTVWVNWTPAGSGVYWVSFAGQGFDVGDLPISYTPPRCGEHDLIFSVSPAECPDEPGFTHSSNSISFTIPCPTTVTEVAETEGQPSGTQALYPSLLLAVAATIPLLKWQH